MEWWSGGVVEGGGWSPISPFPITPFPLPLMLACGLNNLTGLDVQHDRILPDM